MKTNREILKFAFPAIIENFLQMLVGVSDTMIVAHLSLSAVAAVSLANNLITVYQAILLLGNNCFKSICQSAYCKEGRGKPERLINSATKLTFFNWSCLGGCFSCGSTTYSLFTWCFAVRFQSFPLFILVQQVA